MSKCECKNCVHEDVCRIRTYPSQYGLTGDGCEYYKAKSLFVELPCKVGDTIYQITTCEYFNHELDGTLYDGNGGYGTATGYYCPCELRDNCPFDSEENFDCDKQKNKLAVFEDEVKGFLIGEYGEITILLDYTGNEYISEFGKTLFLTKEDAEAKLKEIEGK